MHPFTRDALKTLGDRLVDLAFTNVTDHRDAEGDMCWRLASLSWNLAIAALCTLAADQAKRCDECGTEVEQASWLQHCNQGPDPTPEEIQDADSGGVCVQCGEHESEWPT